MPKFAANLSMLFTERPFLDRFEAAAQAGFRAVEIQFAYEYPVEQLAARLQTHRLELVLHNLPAGKWAAGERGIACHPDRVAEFQDGVGEAIRYARVLGVKQLNCLAGIAPAGVDRERLQATFIANLKYAASELRSAGLRLLTEPINTFDVPGFYLNRSQQALDIIAATGADNLLLQYDIYHMQRMEGELASSLRKNLAQIGHVQVADNPGRNEPGTGEINFSYLFRVLDEIGYAGWVGCEYKPAATTEAGLGWLRSYV